MRTALLLGLFAIAHSIDKMSGQIPSITVGGSLIEALMLILCVIADISEWITNLFKNND